MVCRISFETKDFHRARSDVRVVAVDAAAIKSAGRGEGVYSNIDQCFFTRILPPIVVVQSREIISAVFARHGGATRNRNIDTDKSDNELLIRLFTFKGDRGDFKIARGNIGSGNVRARIFASRATDRCSRNQWQGGRVD